MSRAAPARFLVHRALGAVVVLLSVSVLTFGLLELAPGDPARSVLESRTGGRPPSDAAVAAQRVRMGLDDPVALRYLRWAGGAVRGDLGASYITGRPVVEELRRSLPWTLLLTATATALSAVAALGVGLFAGMTRRWPLRRAVDGGMFVLGGMPGFVTGLLLLYLLSARWHLLPSGGAGRPGDPVTLASVASHVTLPAAALAFGHHFGAYVQLVQTGVRDLRAAPHVDSARARGLRPSTIAWRHVLRPALAPFVVRLGVGTGALLAGAYAIEVIFSWPGLGRQAIAAATAEDYPVLTGAVLVTAGCVLVANLVGDALAALLDPRVRMAPARPRQVHSGH